jgi:hypothetical protein
MLRAQRAERVVVGTAARRPGSRICALGALLVCALGAAWADSQDAVAHSHPSLARPNTVIVSGPAQGGQATVPVRLAFKARHHARRFECRLDGEGWEPCRSPVSYARLGDGSHLFKVRAISARRKERRPARRSFAIAAPAIAAPSPAAASEIFPSAEVWDTPLPDTVPIDPASPEMMATLQQAVDAQLDAGTGPRLGINSRTTLYRVGPGVARAPVALDTGPHGAELASEFARGVPIPPSARPITGADSAMAIYQPSTDTYWEFFRMQQALHCARRAEWPTVSGGGALPAGRYSYRVTSLNANGESDFGKNSGIDVNVHSPDSAATISWNPIEGATAYRIYRSENGGPPGYLATVEAPGTSFTDTGATAPSGPPPTVNTATTPGQWRAAYGGVIHNASQSPGYYRDRTDASGAVIEESGWGSSATKMPLALGLVTKADLDRGYIDHALSIGLPNSNASMSIIRAGTFAYPAQDADGRASGPGTIPEGTRLRLDPGYDLSQISNPFARMLAVAARDYGMIVHDGSAGVVIYAEDPAPYDGTSEEGFYEAYAGPRPAQVAAQLPWDHLQVVQMHLCTARPCEAS